MSALVYVHGTNGSGKSTLARKLGMAAGGFGKVRKISKNSEKVRWTDTSSGTVFVGQYGNRCGGVDGIHPYAAVFDILDRVSDRNTFMEGLLTPGLDTCARMASMYDEHLFIALTTPVEICVQHVMRRRIAAGNRKPYDPSNLMKKARTVLSWAERLEKHGLNVHLMSYGVAYLSTLELLGLREPSVEDLLGE